MTIASALTIAGSDSGGGAGVQADLKTFSALGVYGTCAITAITAQNTVSVDAVFEMDPNIVASQVAAVLADIRISTVKIGMVASPEIMQAIAESLSGFVGSVVLDPVMVAKSGARLLQQDAVDALVGILLPMADIVTPNLPEAAALLGSEIAVSENEMERQGREIAMLAGAAVLVKGGHSDSRICTDILVGRDGQACRHTAVRSPTRNTHGTGCTYSAAIAAGLAKGLALQDAVAGAHSFLQRAIRAADELEIGSGHGPVHHFVGIWDQNV